MTDVLKFGTIIADPPWEFENVRTRAAAENHYPTLPTRQIIRLPVEDWAADNSHLYLWVTAAHLKDGLQVMEAWGFDYKQYLTWVKVSENGKLQIGLGNYYRHATEICLFGTRGKAKALVHDLPNVFWAPRSKHSRKPDTIHEWAEKLSPEPRLEMFARRGRLGWASWGNEAPSSYVDPADKSVHEIEDASQSGLTREQAEELMITTGGVG